ncbi:MAG: type II secretion system secretin GspD [Gammaproteobacteria bacterium]
MRKNISDKNCLGKTLRWVMGIYLLFLSGIVPAFAANTVTLNFKDADIDSVIGWMAEQTGKNFVVDPRVKSKVTIISGKPLNKDELYQVFLSVLQVHGFAAVPSGEVIKIVPDINAKQDGVPVGDARHPGRGDEVITRVIPLENVPAAQLVPILRPLIPQQGHMVAYPPSNVLIISDHAVNIDRIAKIISRVDVPSAENQVEVIHLHHASAVEVARILTTLEQQNQRNVQKQGGHLEGRATIIADERTNSILLGGGKTNRLQIRALVSNLDIPLEREGNIHVIYLRYANAKDLVPVLTGIGQSVVKEEQAKKGGAAAKRQSSSPAFDIQADESTNALVITASLEVFRSLRAVIRQLDVRRAQVLVEGIIAEISVNKAAQLGIQWAVDATPGGHGPIGFTNFASGTGSSLGEIAAAAVSGTVTSVPEGLSLGVGRFNSNNINFGALLRALRGDGSTNVLSTPTLLTLDNQEAEIVVGQNVPFVTGSYSSVSNANTVSNPFQTIQRQNVGIDLKVKPQINEGNTIKLDVEQKVDSLAASSAGAADLITNTRSIKTTVLVDDGQVVVLGGLIKNDLKESEQKVPGLGDLPLIGGLFRYKTSTKDKTDLMVFLHPVIMRDEQLLANVSGDKYNYIRAKELALREKGVSLLPDESTPLMRPLDELRELPAPFSNNPPPPAKP